MVEFEGPEQAESLGRELKESFGDQVFLSP